MAVDFTTRYSGKIAERFHAASVTDSACGNEYQFVGAQTVRVYSVNTVPETPYNRAADGNRFGPIRDLDTGLQELHCTQAPAFTFTVDALDNSDTAIDNAAGKALRRQLDEVTVPAMDKYRLKKWVMGANIQHTRAAAPTKTDIVEAILELGAAMTDAQVPLENRTLFLTTKMYTCLKQNPDFIRGDELGKEALVKGRVGRVDGMDVKPVPAGWFPEGVYFLIKHRDASVDPAKLQKYDVLPQVQGYSGPVVQGVTYYDAFVLGAKGDGIAVCGSDAAILAAPAMTAAAHAVTIAPAAGVSFRYTTDGSNPRYSAAARTYSAPVTLTPGQTLRAVGVKDGYVGAGGEKDYE